MKDFIKMGITSIVVITIIFGLIYALSYLGKHNQLPYCTNVVELTYIDGYTETVNYYSNCMDDIYQYENQTKIGYHIIAYNTIRFKLISKTQVK